MKRFLTAGVTCLAMLGATQALAQETAAAEVPKPMLQPRDWSATLAQDATALHDIMIDSHPGVHDPLNPEFRTRLDQGLATALERANRVWKERLAAYEKPGIDPAIEEEINAFVDKRKAEGGAPTDF